ncbi:cryptochrome dash, chloroplastic/mitochondrial [Fagus crenata]
MPLLSTFPHFPSLSFLPNTRLLYSPTPRSRLSLGASKITVTVTESHQSEPNNGASSILWFKHDLRVDDHPGLVAASKSRALVPLYVFDHRILSRYSDEMQEMVLFAVEDLRKSLKELGSDLMIRFGSAENVIQELVKEVKATNVYAEEEVEYDIRMVMDIVKETLETVFSREGSARLVLWQTPFYDIKNLKDLPASHDDFRKLQFSITSPVPPPTLPSGKMELDWGPLPTFDVLKEFMNKNRCKPQKGWTSIKEISAESILLKKLLKPGESNQNDLSVRNTQRKLPDKSAFVTQKGNFVGGGTNTVLNALAGYLRYLEGTARDDWQEVHGRVRNAETRDGASFTTLFGPALCLGILSRRKVHYDAIKYEKDRNAGFLSPFGYSAATIAAAVDAVCSMEWYWLMGLKNLISYNGTYSIRIWRWKGHLIQYAVFGHEGPAILLVHGFGAFLEHYRDNIYGIAEGGNRVWALTILGFGKSEKPNTVYTEVMWAELLRDFIVEVVGEPVHLVGNSIGGYIGAIAACFWHALVKSIVLINSAGNVVPGYSSVPFTKERQTSVASWLGARLLLFYLRLRLKDIVKNCYPTKPERVDDRLVNEMLRASYDPGVPVVLESIFSFNLSIPLNYLLEGFEEKVLIIQGMKDPISDSKSKLAMLKEHCAGVVIRELDAGHCPHDELPEEVNSMICEWVGLVRSKLPAESLS